MAAAFKLDSTEHHPVAKFAMSLPYPHAPGTDLDIAQWNEAARRLRHANPEAALNFGLQALSKAQQLNDPLRQAHSLLQVVAARLALAGPSDELMERAAECLALMRAAHDLPGECAALNLLAGLCSQRNQLAIALEHYHQGLALRRRLGDRAGEAGCLSNIGRIHAETARFAEALKFLFLSLEVGEAAQDARAMAYALDHIGVVLGDLGDAQQAMEFQLRGLTLARRTDDRTLEGSLLCHLGALLTRTGESGSALPYLQQALALARQSGRPEALGLALLHLAVASKHREAAEQAEAWLREALDLARRSRRQRLEAEVLQALGTSRLARGETQSAIDLLNHALRIVTDIQGHALAASIDLQLSNLHEQAGRFELALRHCRRYEAAQAQIHGLQTQRRVRALLRRTDIEQAQTDADQQRQLNSELAAALQKAREAEREKQHLIGLLSKQAEQLTQLAREDGLTGLANRRWLDSELLKERERARRFGHPLAVAMMDIDHFKSINDRFSHSLGDQVLRTVARLLRESCRLSDVVGRYGGEEFALLLPETSLANAAVLCEKLRSRIERHDWALLHPELTRVTISIGLSADNPLAPATVLDSMATADQQLYRAKREGRNRVCQ
jgi:diguanylate cyclase (GGDEF)-like protein